ncbi:MAG: ABC transporter permease subunit [Candidatus Riflebacteria bacterium]|nr:ABC transporter permease subunit [Candidatus Riflebacteria bacterium]
MTTVLLIARREWYGLFATPTAWGLATLYQVLGGIIFCHVLDAARFADLAPLHATLAGLNVFLFPIVTMGRIAQERRQGTMELLLTSPVEPWQIVWGKYLGVLGFALVITILSLQYPLILAAYGKPDAGQWVPATLGLFLDAALFCAVGLFASALTANQVLAGITALALSLFLCWARELGRMMGFAEQPLEGLTVISRFASFNRGTLDSRDLFYFVALSWFFLVLAARGVESDRW